MARHWHLLKEAVTGVPVTGMVFLRFALTVYQLLHVRAHTIQLGRCQPMEICSGCCFLDTLVKT